MPSGPVPAPRYNPQMRNQQSIPAPLQRPGMMGMSAPVEPVGAWMRWLANILDFIVVAIVAIPISMLMVALLAGVIASAISGYGNDSLFGAIFAIFIFFLTMGIIYFFYKPIMESSKLQATVGKLIIGAKVTDEDGGQIGFGKAFYRYFLSSLLMYIIYFGLLLLCNFTDAPRIFINLLANFPLGYQIYLGVSIGSNGMKQGFHDRAAGTMVVRR
ncbi:MAG: RDD family protein [bacterium]